MATVSSETTATRKRKSWSEELVIKTIQTRYMNGSALNPQDLQLEDSSLLAAGRRYFGSWSKALEAAHVPPVPRHWTMRHRRGYWTRDLLLEEIRRHAAQGDPLYAHAMQSIDNCLVSAATYHFGSWAEALEAAGFDADSIRATRRHTAASVIEQIGKLLTSGQEVVESTVSRDDYTLYRAAQKYFGSWQKAVENTQAQMHFPGAS